MLGCASERTAPSAPPGAAPTPAPPAIAAAPPATATATATASAPTPEPADAAAPVDALDAAPPDRKRCPLFPPTRGSTPWQQVSKLNGLSDEELRVCYGEPVTVTGETRRFFFPRGCSYERAELELKMRGGRVVSGRVRNFVTGEHCM